MTRKEQLSTDYKTAKGVLDKLGIKFFAVQGTALGAVRDGDFIEWDWDIDLVGFMTPEQEVKVREMMAAEGFKVDNDYCVPMGDGTCRKIIGYIRSIRNTLVDIYRVLEDEDGYFMNDIGPLRFEKGTLDNLLKVKLGDQDCFVPNPPELQLVKLFGEDWATPQKYENIIYYT